MPGSLTDGISVLLGTLYLTNRYSSEDWGPRKDGDSVPLTLPTIFSLDLLNLLTAHRQSTTHHPTLDHILGLT